MKSWILKKGYSILLTSLRYMYSNNCMDMRKYDWFGFKAILLSGISNLLTAHLDKNAVYSNLSTLIKTITLIKKILDVFIFQQFWQAFIMRLAVTM